MGLDRGSVTGSERAGAGAALLRHAAQAPLAFPSPRTWRSVTVVFGWLTALCRRVISCGMQRYAKPLHKQVLGWVGCSVLCRALLQNNLWERIIA